MQNHVRYSRAPHATSCRSSGNCMPSRSLEKCYGFYVCVVFKKKKKKRKHNSAIGELELSVHELNCVDQQVLQMLLREERIWVVFFFFGAGKRVSSECKPASLWISSLWRPSSRHSFLGFFFCLFVYSVLPEMLTFLN